MISSQDVISAFSQLILLLLGMSITEVAEGYEYWCGKPSLKYCPFSKYASRHHPMYITS